MKLEVREKTLVDRENEEANTRNFDITKEKIDSIIDEVKGVKFFKSKDSPVVRSENPHIIKIECDSVCHPNPGGLGCFAWVAYNAKREVIETHYEVVGRGEGITNNSMEYRAVNSALEWAWGKDFDVDIFTSSELLVKQVSGEWGCRSEILKPLLQQTLAGFNLEISVTVNWIPQSENKAASYFCYLAYQKAGQDE